MIYVVPKKYQCPRCQFEMLYSPNHTYSTPINTLVDSPLCPECWFEFIRKHVPTMVQVDEPHFQDKVNI